ncbi:glycerol-3-phosphate O-acyltransferase 2 [Stylosanthes scabra]|uniref:Glycerol-3-phosphate O-acyltransferase 2 n=1 Tax=Stylosanthes scabra TaxID=79078 RepID=A0ABU6UGB0_9FABA|nr:glycerol-3-phosphate O-acyltransferase 2 [Stylosanthes scabra]
MVDWNPTTEDQAIDRTLQRNIFSKKGMKGMSVSGMNYYACLSILSLLILTPFAVVVEGPKMWAVGWQTVLSQIGPNFV